jgi:hypothetical protein
MMMRKTDMKTSHGSPFDCGLADSWYDRVRDPHKFVVGRDSGKRVAVAMDKLTQQEIWEYNSGYNWNEKFGGKKDFFGVERH